jgi:hypothetical protein
VGPRDQLGDRDPTGLSAVDICRLAASAGTVIPFEKIIRFSSVLLVFRARGPDRRRSRREVHPSVSVDDLAHDLGFVTGSS